MRYIAALCVLAGLASCSGTNSASADASANIADADLNAPDADPNAPDANPNAPDANPNAPDANPNAPDAAPLNLPRGLTWVRTHPMFISGLNVSVGAPSTTAVTEYFEQFNANAVHLWQTGLPTEMNSWKAANHPAFRFVSWVAADGNSSDSGGVIGGYPANSAGRIGYQIGDEPRTLADAQGMNVGVNAVRAADPDALIIINFSSSAEELTQILAYYPSMDADVVSFDNYSRRSGVYQQMQRFRDLGIANQQPYWCYLSSYIGSGADTPSTESDTRWNAFAHLAWGYTGFTWFVYQLGPPHNTSLAPTLFASDSSYAATKTAQFGYAAQVNLELANLGRAITQLTHKDVRYMAAVSLLQPSNTTGWSPGAGGDSFITKIEPVGSSTQDLIVSFFADDAGEIYVYLLNVNHEGGKFPFNNNNDATIRVTFDFSSSTDPSLSKTAVRSLNQLTGAVEDLALTAAGANQATLEVTLAAGDPVLFKYKTARPFALQQ